MNEFTSARPAPLRDDPEAPLESVPFQVCEWKAETPVLTAETAAKCEVKHGLSAALSRAYEITLRRPHREVRTRPLLRVAPQDEYDDFYGPMLP